MNKLAFLFDILGCMDWLTPLMGLLDSSTDVFYVNGHDIWAVDELKRKGVKVKRIQNVPIGNLAFEVPKEQTKLAVLLLKKMNLDIQFHKDL
jgi:hypothetical protein